MTTDPYDATGPLLGAVLEEGRGSLPFALIHGEALVTCAAWALGEAGVSPVDLGPDRTALAELAELAARAETAGTDGTGGETDPQRPFVLHDSLCPMTPAGFVAECVAHAERTGEVVVGTRPVTDTVKQTADGRVGETVDRDQLLAVASPVVLPAPVLAVLHRSGAVAELPVADLAALVPWLRERFAVALVTAPSEGRRVASEDDVRLLEALTSR
ncbi:2-C-methyl-D-erythritol 4-phosphate cytidylyltransferase [Nocardioides ferulae]|uniref:2-C-methyl-D-erythritol 4-phosphate cytidylyltransferase n=1 Tax=Nocardioides ferulae TaxID=2340821 RepID=UPI000EAC2C7E|nr:2-C-methyl-D-erythritol 4-phosphate cytidylyltransferase [Nocardioides ferulae]